MSEEQQIFLGLGSNMGDRYQNLKKGIHQLKPGITGWAQVNGRDELNIPIKVQFDEYYLKNRSWFLDLKILFLTLLRVLGMKGISH